jgi:tetratricopeptide (TPR) repeat protein
MTADSGPQIEFEDALGAAQALLEAEQFDAGLAAVQQLLERLPRDPDEAQREQLYRLLMARVAALIKLDRFDQVLHDCAGLLDLVSVDQASAQRAGVMIQLSFAQANLLMPEQALRAAHVALEDGLQLHSSLLTAQALERLAMAYLSMGDGGAALSFMFQALEHMDQSNSGYERLRRYSNALHLICTLFDAYTDAGQFSEAAAVRERAAIFNQQADALAPQVSSHYIVSMWRANLARWQRRCGLVELARGAFVELEQRAAAAGWHAVRRPVQLELALLEEEQGRPQPALSLLAAVFEPADLRVRDVVALPSLRAQMRCFTATGQTALAALAGEQWAARQALRRQAEGRAKAQLPGLDQRILAGLAAAERARLDEVVRLLREQRQRGAGLKLLDHDWSDPVI